jgi:hypothetical protein
MQDVYREAERVSELLDRDEAMQEFVDLARQVMRWID